MTMSILSADSDANIILTTPKLFAGVSLGMRPHKPSGFTLVEMLLVVVVIGLLVVLAAPALSGRKHSPQRDACNLALLCGQVRNIALKNGCAYQLELEFDSGLYSVAITAVDDSGVPVDYVEISTGPFECVDLRGIVTDTDGYRAVVFTPDGVSDSHRFRFGGERGPVVEIDSPSGLARVLDYEQFRRRELLLGSIDSYWQSNYSAVSP